MTQEITEKVATTLAKLNSGFGVEMPMPEIKINGRLRGVAGRATGFRLIEINPRLYEAYRDDMVKVTVPHEVCHNFADYYYRILKRMKIKGHGREWGNFMRFLGLEPKQCHNYSLEEAGIERVKRKKYTFTCCGLKYVISSVRYNKMRKTGGVCHCRRCKRTIWTQDWILIDNPPSQVIVQEKRIITMEDLGDIDLGDEFGS